MWDLVRLVLIYIYFLNINFLEFLKTHNANYLILKFKLKSMKKANGKNI